MLLDKWNKYKVFYILPCLIGFLLADPTALFALEELLSRSEVVTAGFVACGNLSVSLEMELGFGGGKGGDTIPLIMRNGLTEMRTDPM